MEQYELAEIKVNNEIAIAPEYKGMLEQINSALPAINQDSQNFYKSSSQFKNVTLDVTELTPMSSLKHILAVLDQTRQAIEESTIELKRKQIKLAQKQHESNLLDEGFEKDLVEIDILELETQIKNSGNYIKGAIRKMSFFVTQYKAMLNKMGVEHITEEDYEKNEARHHILTAMKQALISARGRGGSIDEGNQIYLFELGINGGAAQQAVLEYLIAEQKMLENGEVPSHQFTMDWLNACADKFESSAVVFAESRGFVPLDETSILKELKNA